MVYSESLITKQIRIVFVQCPIIYLKSLSWLKKAANHVEEIEELLLGDYHVDKAQMDSLWTYVGNKGKKGGTKRNQIKVLSGVER